MASSIATVIARNTRRARLTRAIDITYNYSTPIKWSPPVSLVSLVSVYYISYWLASLLNLITPISGANREVKKAVEAYWAGKLSADELTKAAADVRKASWISVKSQGVDYIPRYVRY